MTVLAAAAADPSPGWGKLLALLGAGLLCWAFTVAHGRWKAAKEQSPTAGPLAVEGIKPQVSDGVDPVDPGGDPVVREWGRIDYADGSARVVLPARKPQVNGSPVGPDPVSAVVDLDTWVASRLGRQRPADIIREAKRQFRRSEATVKRSIRRVRTSGTSKEAS